MFFSLLMALIIDHRLFLRFPQLDELPFGRKHPFFNPDRSIVDQKPSSYLPEKFHDNKPIPTMHTAPHIPSLAQTTGASFSKAIAKIGEYDIIICGKQASDGDTAQVGPGISTHLGIPQITYVKKIDEINDTQARVERMTEEGFEIIETPLPCLITVVKEINEPRLPSLRGKMKAKKAEIVRMSAEDIACDFDKIGLDGSPTRVVKIFTPPPRKGGVMLQGDVSEIAGTLVSELKNEL